MTENPTPEYPHPGHLEARERISAFLTAFKAHPATDSVLAVILPGRDDPTRQWPVFLTVADMERALQHMAALHMVAARIGRQSFDDIEGGDFGTYQDVVHDCASVIENLGGLPAPGERAHTEHYVALEDRYDH